MSNNSFSDWIYLDNAASSYPKPPSVYEAVDWYQRENGRPIGRGATDAAQAVRKTVDQCRLQAAQLLGASAKEQIVFTGNCTDSLNLVLHGLLRPGDHVVSTVAEHNSILRPLRAIELSTGITVSLVNVNENGRVVAEDIAAAIRPATRLIALQHASNVTGVLQPVAEVAEIAAARGVLLLVDAAQTAGHVPLQVSAWPADFVACAGHKGLLGPLGTGLLYVAPGRERLLTPQRQGGTGSRSELDMQPDEMPDRFEAGNLNAPGIIGLAAGLQFVLDRGVSAIQSHEQQLRELLRERLKDIPGVAVYADCESSLTTGVLSFRLPGFAPDEISTLLSQHFRIDTRSGLHCAPQLHRRLGTLETGGTVRVSVGWSTQPEHIEQLVDAVTQLAQAG